MCYIRQKNIISHVYNYIRYPITIYCPTVTYIAYCENKLIDYNVYIILYINLMLFFNGAFYNKLTVENYVLHKEKGTPPSTPTTFGIDILWLNRGVKFVSQGLRDGSPLFIKKLNLDKSYIYK